MALNLKSWNLSASIAVLFIGLMTILSELSTWFHDVLVAISGNHWISKGIISVVLFVVLGFLFSKFDVTKKCKWKDSCWVWATITSTVVSGLAIFVFYLWHYFA